MWKQNLLFSYRDHITFIMIQFFWKGDSSVANSVQFLILMLILCPFCRTSSDVQNTKGKYLVPGPGYQLKLELHSFLWFVVLLVGVPFWYMLLYLYVWYYCKHRCGKLCMFLCWMCIYLKQHCVVCFSLWQSRYAVVSSSFLLIIKDWITNPILEWSQNSSLQIHILEWSKLFAT